MAVLSQQITRHSREGGSPVNARVLWIPAFAGMTIRFAGMTIRFAGMTMGNAPSPTLPLPPGRRESGNPGGSGRQKGVLFQHTSFFVLQMCCMLLQSMPIRLAPSATPYYYHHRLSRLKMSIKASRTSCNSSHTKSGMLCGQSVLGCMSLLRTKIPRSTNEPATGSFQSNDAVLVPRNNIHPNSVISCRDNRSNSAMTLSLASNFRSCFILVWCWCSSASRFFLRLS
mgnify:CR=1 FL=1